MKLALVLHGFSKAKTAYKPQPFRGWNYQADCLVDYKLSLQNYRNKIFDSANTDVFFHTWDTDLLDETEIVSDLNPVGYEISDPNVDETVLDKDRRTSSRQETIYRSLQLFDQNSNGDYDFVVVTRFDLHFHFGVPRMLNGQTVDKSDLLVSFWLHEPKLADDNFYAFHPSKLDQFKQMVRSTRLNQNSNGLHHMHQKWNGDDIKPIFSGRGHNVNVKNPFYHIVRYVSRRDNENYRYVYSEDNTRALNCKYCQG